MCEKHFFKIEIKIYQKKYEEKQGLGSTADFIFKLYITVLDLPNIKMNPPQVYMLALFEKCPLLMLPTPPTTV